MIRKLKKGFTLVELVVVIAVIAILAAVSVVSYLSITKKAKESHDQQIIDQINLSLSAEEAAGRKPETMHKALEVVEADGFAPERFNSNLYSGYDLAYLLKENKFVLLTKNTSTVIYPEGVSADAAHELWKFTAADGDLTDGFSHYLSGEDQTGARAVSTGLDVGKNTGISAVTYTGVDPAKNVVIRSNSYETVVNATAFESGSGESYTCDVIKHYGKAGEINIVKAGAHSYHEFGDVAFLYVESGHAFVEHGSKVVTIVSGDEAVVLQNSGGTVQNAYGVNHTTNTGNIPLDSVPEEDIEEIKKEAEDVVNPLQYVECDDPDFATGLTYSEYNTGNIGTWSNMVFSETNRKLTSSVTIDNEDGAFALLGGTINLHLNTYALTVTAESSPVWGQSGTFNIYGKGRMSLNDAYGATGCFLINGATVNIYNGTFEDNSTSSKLFGLDGGSLNIHSGTFYGRIVPHGGTLNIESGIFRNSGFTVETIAQYVASGSIITQVDDAIVVIK